MVETKSFELPNMSEPINPLERPATIGEYYVMQNHLRGHSGLKEYRSAWRDIFIYNEDKDGFTRIGLDVALRHCGRFDQDGDLTNPGAIAESRNGDMPPDMFLRRNDGTDANLDGKRPWVPTEHMGDIHSMYLRDGGLGDWADSVVSKLLAAEPGIARAIRDGIDMCQKIDDVNSSEGAQNTWFMWLWLVHVLPRVPQQWDDEHGLPYPPTKEDVEHDDTYRNHLCFGTVGGARSVHHGMMDTTEGVMKALPVGYASWPGLCILANPKYKKTFGQYHEIAVKFVSAFETLYSTLRQHATDSVFMDGRNAPPWLKARDGRSTLFANLIYVSDAPIWIRIPSDGGYVKIPDIEGGVLKYPRLDTDADVTVSNVPVTNTYKIDVSKMEKLDMPPDDFKTIFKKGMSYTEWLSNVREYISSEIFGSKSSDEPVDPTFGRILDRFIDLFSRNPVALSLHTKDSHTPSDYGNIGNVLIQLFVKLMQEVKNLKQQETGKDGETKLYRIAAFVNMGAKATTMHAFMEFLIATKKILDENYYDTENQMEWATKVGKRTATASKYPNEEHKCMRDYILEKIVENSGFKFEEIPEFEMNPAIGNTPTLPANVIEYGNGESILPTHLVGGAGLRSIMSRWSETTAPMAAFAMIVSIDPFGHVPGLDGYEDNGKRQHYADRVPPMFNGRRALANKGTSKPIFGAGSKRPARFGARDSRMPQAKRRTMGAFGDTEYDFEGEDEDDGAGAALGIDPWNVGISSGSGSMRNLSRSFQERYRLVARAETDMLRRCLKLCFLGLPVTYGTFARIIGNDDVFPFGFLLLRPYITYSMASAILTVAGSSTGETLVGHADFQLVRLL